MGDHITACRLHLARIQNFLISSTMSCKQFIIVAAIYFTCCLAFPLECDKGEEYWCKDPETAIKCGVEEHCKILNMEKMVRVSHRSTPAPPVNVSLYYESLCPGCRGLIYGQIYPTYQALKSTGIVDIQLFPYGNAREHKSGEKWIFECQHGERECQVNTVEACALHLLPNVDKMDYIHCIESSLEPTVESGKRCAQKFHLEWQPIFNCYNGSMGNFLEHQIAEKTDALKPRHLYVPWITLNGVHTEDIQDKMEQDMLGYVCSVYTGPKPPVCNKVANTRPAQPKRGEKCYKY